MASLIGLAATLTALVAIVSTVAAVGSIRQLDRTTKAERETQLALGKSTTAERQARLALGKSLLSEGAALQRTGLSGQRFASLDRLSESARVLRPDPEGRKQLPQIRNHAIAALGLTDLDPRSPLDCGDVFGICVDAALERHAVMERSGEVVVRRLIDGGALVRLPGPGWPNLWYGYPTFSPDGELLAAEYNRTSSGGNLLQVWHLGRQELLGSLLMLGEWALAFHPDGRRMLFAAPEGGIAIWDRRERRVVRRLPLVFTANYLAIDPEGRRLAVNRYDASAPRVVILDIETGGVLADWNSQVGCGAMGWSADGQWLAIGGDTDDNRVYVWNVRMGTLTSILQGHTSAIGGAQFAHAGHRLTTVGWDGTTRLWDAVSGEALVTAPGNFLGTSPDDRRLAIQVGGTISVRDVAAGNECRTLQPGMLGNRSERRDFIGVLGADFSPDGRLLATCDGDGIRLWEADTGATLAHVKCGLCATVLFHPDGQSLISSGQVGLISLADPARPRRQCRRLLSGPPSSCEKPRITVGGTRRAGCPIIELWR